MRIIKNNAPVKQEICWNCNSILELNLIDYDTDGKCGNYDGNFYSFLATYFICPCCHKKNYCAVTIDGEEADLKRFNR